LQEFIDAKVDLPSVNQCPFHSHLYSAQKDLVDFCSKHNILFNSYSPLGIPDFRTFPSAISTTGVLIEEPVLKTIGAAHNLTPAQVLLAWEWSYGMVANPRTMNVTHMNENLASAVFTTKFTDDEMRQLEGFKPDECSVTNHFYECCGPSSLTIPKCH